MSNDWATPGEESVPEPGQPDSGVPDLPPPAWPPGAPPPPSAGPGTGVPPPPDWYVAPQTPSPAPAPSGLIPLHQMNLGDLLDVAFRILRERPGPIILFLVVMTAPGQVLSATGFSNPLSIMNTGVDTGVSTAAAVSAGLGTLILLLVAPITQGGLTWFAMQLDRGERPEWADAARAGLRSYGSILGAWALLALGGTVLVIVVAVIATVLVAAAGPVGVVVLIPLAPVALAAGMLLVITGYMTVPTIVVEGLGVMAGLRRAWSLIRSRFWPVIGISMLLGLVFGILGSTVSTVVSLPAFLDIPGSWLFAALGGILDRLITAPLGAFAALALYVDLRIRAEGYDISMLVNQLRR